MIRLRAWSPIGEFVALRLVSSHHDSHPEDEDSSSREYKYKIYIPQFAKL